MNFNEYQKEVHETAVYPVIGEDFVWPVIGLAGETGEFCEKIKKLFRDDRGILSKEALEGLGKELGDILWHVSELAMCFGHDLDDIAIMSIEKMRGRRLRGTLQGSGDDR